VGKGTLHISVKRVDRHLRFLVKDDGVGIDAKTVQRILSGNYDSNDKEKTGIGLESVRKRLQLHFGSHHRFAIQSTPGEGTTIVVEIPVISAVEDGDHVSYRDRG
jgi:two-component system sensor histidine kinase YesM